MTDLQKLLDEATPGPWTGHNMVHADGNRPMTPEEIGEYVKNSVKMGESDRFLFISAPHPDGGSVDVCHTGNGPRGPANTALMAQAPDLAKRVLELEAAIRCVIETDDYLQRGEIYRSDGVHSKHDSCIHGLPAYNGCEACVCDFLSKALKGGVA